MSTSDHEGDGAEALEELRVKHLELQGENARLRREGRFAAIFEQAAIGVCQVDLTTGRFLDINQRYCDLVGYSREALEELGFPAVTHPDDRAVSWEGAQRLLRGEIREFIVEKRYLHKNGSLVWGRMTSAAMWAPGEAPDTAVTVVEDITERKRAEAALRASEEKWRSLFSILPVGIATVGSDGAIAEPNPALGAILGLRSDARPDGTYEEPSCLRADGSPMPREEFPSIRALNEQREIHAVEVGVIRDDGTTAWAEVSASPSRFPGANGVLVATDITERKSAEHEKARLESRLQHAMKLESVGRLAGGVAHDFNNMLGAILANTELALTRVGASDPLHADLLEIEAAARRSADLTRQLLAFARKQTVEPKVLDLNATVASLLTMLRRMIRENIAVSWAPGAGVWPVEVDPSQLDQILTNLCVNARDAIADVGTISIATANVVFTAEDCATRADVLPGDYVLLSVRDDGCGMDEKTAAEIFEPFFTTKGLGAGTGLGLSTVYGAVTQNRGYVDVESEPGKGTTFRVHLPRYAGEATEIAARAPAIPAQTKRGQETILLVEDEPAILKVATRVLEAQGYIVLKASRPTEAVRMAMEHPTEIHLLLSDVVMPEMNGRDLASTLLGLRPRMKRLFMSGYTADVIADQGVLARGVPFIQKPFSIAELCAKVRETLDSRDP